MNRQKVLILDDDKSIRESLVAYLEDEEFDVVGIESAEEAIQYMGNATVNAAIVDLRLPGMNGETFIRQVYDRFPETVFLIYTGSPEYTPMDDVAALPRVSETIYIKPVEDVKILLDEIRRLIRSKGASSR